MKHGRCERSESGGRRKRSMKRGGRERGGRRKRSMKRRVIQRSAQPHLLLHRRRDHLNHDRHNHVRGPEALRTTALDHLRSES